MYLLDGKRITPFKAFVHNDIQYPAGWWRLTSASEKAAIGITEVPDPPRYDQKFYWGYDADGALIPKDHSQLIEQYTAQTKQTAASLLSKYDWYVIRASETGTVAPQEVIDYRASVRTVSDSREAAIADTVDTDALAELIKGNFGGEQEWPRDPFEPEPEVVEESIEPEPEAVEEPTTETV
jgi:hypothetical protein